MMTLVGNLDDPHLSGVCTTSVGARVVMCVHAIVMFRFLVCFPLINRSILLFIINKNDKYFSSFQKK
jgi:hypothetical protein